MALAIEPTGATLGAIVRGVDLATLGQATFDEIEVAFHEYGALIFPDQQLSSAAQIAFAERFGKIEQLYADHKSVPISNKLPNGNLADDESHQMQIMRGNEGWHTDSSYMPRAAKASVLSARTVPQSGGQTEWADARAAYDLLDHATQQRIADLAAYHSLFHSQAKIGHRVAVGAGYGFFDGDPPLRPLVKVHPVTGRNALYIGRHAYGIPGLAPDESERLLDELLTFTCQPPRTYMHHWQPGDTVIWDNRCLLHRARPFDHSEARVMVHTRIRGDRATESALATQTVR